MQTLRRSVSIANRVCPRNTRTPSPIDQPINKIIAMTKASWLAAFAALSLAFAGLPSIAGQPAAASPTLAAPQLVIIDTDIGDDIDDAFALALALRSPQLRILGITTDFGDTTLRARLVDRFLHAVSRSGIPVAVGIRTHETGFTQAAYARLQPPQPHPDAVGFLLGQIRAHPGQITLVAIGPLVNVRAAIARDPATLRKLRRVVMMGGSIRRGYNDSKTGAPRPPDPEWNIRCDPAGARALLASGVPVYMMPLDSTQVPLDAANREKLFARQTPLTDQLEMLYGEWSRATGRSTPILYDPVALTYALQPALCPVQPMHLEVTAKGYTRPTPGPPNAQVCLQSDPTAILGFLMPRL
ncbi:MAG TPA: nucleoside hydrolase [Terracidiphilus sp.]|nr:nucleoside hydrolase [Terracidiphilus sp.]